jgi:hypothetical protein
MQAGPFATNASTEQAAAHDAVIYELLGALIVDNRWVPGADPPSDLIEASCASRFSTKSCMI